MFGSYALGFWIRTVFRVDTGVDACVEEDGSPVFTIVTLSETPRYKGEEFTYEQLNRRRQCLSFMVSAKMVWFIIHRLLDKKKSIFWR